MMLNVSRTRVPEKWLSTLTTKPSVGYNTLDKDALVTLEQSRFSVSTIDSELFPELLAWSALMNTSPCLQNIPSDIAEPDDTDTILEAHSPLSLILDPTAVEVGFDQSCFDGLDDLLINHPLEAFAEACWLDAVGSTFTSERATTPTQLLNLPIDRRKLRPRPIMSSLPIPEECDTDEDDSPAHYKQERTSISTIGPKVTPAAALRPTSSATNKTFSTISDEATSFILFEAPLFAPNHYDSVGHFPMPSSRPNRNVPNRIATFCSNLPASWTSVR